MTISRSLGVSDISIKWQPHFFFSLYNQSYQK